MLNDSTYMPTINPFTMRKQAKTRRLGFTCSVLAAIFLLSYKRNENVDYWSCKRMNKQHSYVVVF